MDTREPSNRVALVDTAQSQLEHIGAATMARLLTAVADIALVMDSEGVIDDVTLASDDLQRDGCIDWIGRRWIDTVANDSRQKVEEMLQAATAASRPWRQVNHPISGSADLPIRYSAVQLGQSGQVMAIGRDMRALATMQQRLVVAQQTMDREYAQLRHAETRYRTPVSSLGRSGADRRRGLQSHSRIQPHRLHTARSQLSAVSRKRAPRSI